MTTLAHTSLAAALRAAAFVGRLVEPGDEAYDVARACFNGAIDRRPAAVAFVSDADDVSAAIRACRLLELPFTIRAGGHSISGRSIRDQTLCIDLRALDSVTVDPVARLVRVGGGVLLGELDAATQAHGLAVPAGQISHTGVAGLTLGGGVGWLMRQHGLKVDRLRSVDAVLADGSRARASAEENADLFWALRGGGGDFAAVTSFTFEAVPLGPELLAGTLVYPWGRAKEALRTARELMRTAPDELTVFCVLATAPPAEPFPQVLQGEPVALVGVAWCGALEEGRAVVDRLRATCPPALALVHPMPYVSLQRMLDATAPPGWNYYDKQHFLAEVSDGFVDAVVAGFERVPEPEAHVVIGWLGGQISRVGRGETAFGHRGAGALSWFIGCSGGRPVEAVTAWVRDVWARTERFATGVYVNALDDGRPVRDAYAEDVWRRLVEIKRRYDPDGVFSGNGIG